MKIRFITLVLIAIIAVTSVSAAPALNGASLVVGATAGTGSTHTLTVGVTYDFSIVNGCAIGATTGCVKQFNVYNTTGGGKVLIFSIAAPVGATTAQTVTATSPSVTLAPGTLSVSITAATPDLIESTSVTVTATVPLPGPTNCTVTVN